MKVEDKKNEDQEEIFGEDFDLFSDVIDIIDNNKSEEDPDSSEEGSNDNNEEDEEDNSSEENNETPDEDEDEDSQEDNEDNEDEEDSASQDNDDNSSPLTPYAKFLVEEGVLSNFNLEEFDGTADGLKSAVTGEIQSGIDQYKATLPPEVANLINNYEAGVPFDQILKTSSDAIRYSNINEESISDNEDLQKNIIRDFLRKTTQFSDEKIETQIQRLDEMSYLEDEAKSSLKDLVAFQSQEEAALREKAVNDAKLAQERQVEQITNLDKMLKETDEIIPDIKISEGLKQRVKENLTTAVAYDQYGNPINKVGNYISKDPMKFEVILNYLFEATNEFSDFSVLGKAGKRSAIKELEEASKKLDNGRSGDAKSGVNKKKSKSSSKGLLDAIDKMDF